MNQSDFLVIGSGIAGLNFALQASAFGNVIIITKKDAIESNTNFAQGGIAAVFSKSDHFDLHVEDTLKAGDGLCDATAVEIMVRNAPAEIERLMSIGAAFDKDDKAGGLELGREGGHSRKRIVHHGDMTGAEIEKALVDTAKQNKRIRIFEKHLAFDLVVKEGKCIGARAIDVKNSKVIDFFAKAVVIATGGLCQVYENTSNPEIATGDGVAMGFRAGCFIENLEFVQFHPTALRRKGKPFFLISEAVRGEGGILKNAQGKRFVKELAFRDEVARAIFREMANGQVVLDVSSKDAVFLKKRFPGIYRNCMENGVDITKDPIPIEPVAHYSCGGLKTDIDGRTNIPGLYALGEAACTGVHGANRLASNSLLESLVFSSRAVRAACEYIESESVGYTNLKPLKISDARPYEIKTSLKAAMWKNAGIVRNASGLRNALKRIDKLSRDLKSIEDRGISAETIETRNMLLVSKLITKAALMRRESRGGHYREDYPEKAEEWKKPVVLSKGVKKL
jgi:L-aspartate oxidase